jgi:hypothetical protein
VDAVEVRVLDLTTAQITTPIRTIQRIPPKPIPPNPPIIALTSFG